MIDLNSPHATTVQPAKNSGGRIALLLAIPALMLLAAAGCGSSSSGGTPTAAHSTTSTPTTIDTPSATPSAAPSPTAAALDAFTMPTTALGLSKSTDKTYTGIAEELSSGIQSHGGGTASAAAYMSKSNSKNILILIGVPIDLSYHDIEYQDSIYTGIAGQLSGKNKKSYPAGVMGGSMWCADGSAGSNVKVGICSVVDNGGGLIALYFNHTGAQLAAAMAKLRPAVEKQP